MCTKTKVYSKTAKNAELFAPEKEVILLFFDIIFNTGIMITPRNEYQST